MKTPIAKLKNLHKICFGDSEAYVNFFFDKRYKAENSFVRQADGEPVCAGYYRDFRLNLCGKEVVVPFMTGIATHPEHRMKGLASLLVKDAKEELTRRKFPFVLLHPFNVEFYQKLGFERANNAKKTTLAPLKDNPSATYLPLEIAHLSVMLRLYEEYAKTCPAYKIRTLEDFQEIYEEHFTDGGSGFLLCKNGIPNGYVLYDNGKVGEAVTNDFSTLQALKELHGASFSRDENGVCSLTMASLLDLDAFFSCLPYREEARGKHLFSLREKTYLLEVENGIPSSKQPPKTPLFP